VSEISIEPGVDGGPSRPCRQGNKTTPPISAISSFDRRMTEEAPAPVRRARRAEPEVEAEPADAPRPKNRLRRLLGNISLPWPTGIGGLIGGFGPRPPAPYAEESAEPQIVSPVEATLSESLKPEAVKLETARVEPAKTEDQAIAEELGLSPDLATVDLQRLRRDFAKKNILIVLNPPAAPTRRGECRLPICSMSRCGKTAPRAKLDFAEFMPRSKALP
jgi:hypothetical protein